MDGSNDDNLIGDGDNSVSHSLRSPCHVEHSKDDGREGQLLNSICDSNSAHEGDHMQNSVISAGAFSRIGNSLSSGSRSDSYLETPTAAAIEDAHDGDNSDVRLILNETFERLGSKLMQDCIQTPIEDTTCSTDDDINCGRVQNNCQTPRTQNKATPINNEEIFPQHLQLENGDNNDDDNDVDDDCASPEQRRLENQVMQIEREISAAQHSLEEEEEAHQRCTKGSTQMRTSVDEDMIMANTAVASLRKQMEEADANVYILHSVSDIDEHDVDQESMRTDSNIDEEQRLMSNGNVKPIPTTPSTTHQSTSASRKQSPHKENHQQQLPPKSPMDNSSILSRGISMLKSSKQTTPPPPPPHSNSRRTRGIDTDNSSVVSDITRDTTPKANNKYDDGTLKRHLEESGLLLLKRLIEFLSECPPAPDEDSPIVPPSFHSGRNQPRRRQRGLTLPAAAVGWISQQVARFESDDDNSSESNIEAFEDTEDGYFVPKQQLECVQFLLRRVISVKVSGEPWPPQAATKKATSDNQATSFSSRILSKFTSDQSTAGDNSVDEESCGTSIWDERDKNLSPFQRYYRNLQSKPDINMELFPNATKVVIDGSPPNWITNLDSLKKMDMFQMEKGCLLDINQLFFPSDIPKRQNLEMKLSLIDEDISKEGFNYKSPDIHEEEAKQLFVYSSITKLRLSTCAIGEMSGLRGRSKRQFQHMSSRPKKTPPFSRFPNLVSLNLSHNEIFRVKSAFAGLSSLPMLSSIDLSYNRLSRLDDVFMYIGNVTELILTGNELTSTRGLDRLFSLEHLSLSENKIQNLSDIVGIAKLPFLMKFSLKDNPLMMDDTDLCRIRVFNLFREVRCKNMPKNATYRDMQSLLPALDNELANKDELVALKEFTFRLTVIPTESPAVAVVAAPAPPPHDSNHESANEEGKGIVIDTTAEISVNTPNKAGGLRRIEKGSAPHNSKVRVAGSLLLDDNATRRAERFHSHLYRRKRNKRSTANVFVKFGLDDLLTSIRPEIDHGLSAIETDGDYLRRSRLLSKSYTSQCSRNEDVDRIVEYQDTAFAYTLPASLLEEASDDAWTPSLQADQITPAVTVAQWDEEIDKSVDVGSNHEEEEANENTKRVSFSDQNNFRSMYEIDTHDDDVSGMGVVEGPTTGMFDNIWEEKRPSKSNVPENKKQTVETIAQPLDFQAAEQNAQYDGPSDYSSLSVTRDLDLYFDSYVFPNDSGSDEVVTALSPRIQMYKFDRDALTKSRNRDKDLNLMGGDVRERYLGVWREGVLACGSYARKRLAPVQLPKRGFHGDIIVKGGKDIAVSESRRYILCLSDTALYFIVDDDFSSRKQTKKRIFPSRISPNATFGDAQWPHAVVRHSLDSLKRIVIGFNFQRLTLQFSVSNGVSASSFEYTYVILTSNKVQTVSLLQKLQYYNSDSESDIGYLIENDDKKFLEGLGTGSNEVVLHYQILHQVWKSGNREAARRSFVLTDSKIYLLDENYCGDGTNLSDEQSRRMKLGDVSLAIIDAANLSRVTEVRAANENPRMITLVILPSNKLKRGHRWRLACNDGESAERLIDDVRNACRR